MTTAEMAPMSWHEVRVLFSFFVPVLIGFGTTRLMIAMKWRYQNYDCHELWRNVFFRMFLESAGVSAVVYLLTPESGGIFFIFFLLLFLNTTRIGNELALRHAHPPDVKTY